MKPICQTIKGPQGNCLQASLASILELRLEEVPNFSAMREDALSNYPVWWLELQSWLKARGFCLIEMKLTSLTPVFSMPFAPTCLFFGETKKGVNHCIVGKIEGADLVPVWNPDKEAVILGVKSLGLIVPLDPSRVSLNQIDFLLN